MKKQATANREQGSELEVLLRAALPAVSHAAEPERNLWPAMLRRIEQQPACTPVAAHAVPWFDWALAGALFVLFAVSPGLVPVLLYYL